MSHIIERNSELLIVVQNFQLDKVAILNAFKELKLSIQLNNRFVIIEIKSYLGVT